MRDLYIPISPLTPHQHTTDCPVCCGFGLRADTGHPIPQQLAEFYRRPGWIMACAIPCPQCGAALYPQVQETQGHLALDGGPCFGTPPQPADTLA